MNLGCVPFYERYRDATKEEIIKSLKKRFPTIYVNISEKMTIDEIQNLYHIEINNYCDTYEKSVELLGGKPLRIPPKQLLHEIISNKSTKYTDEEVAKRRLERGEPILKEESKGLEPFPAWVYNK